MRRNTRGTDSPAMRLRCLPRLLALLGLMALVPPAAWSQSPTPEQIQRQREQTERRKIDYMSQKRRVDHINERVRLYKQFMASIPFEAVPNTPNLVQVYVDGHNIRDVAHKIYFVSDGAVEAGFTRYYWPKVLRLNQASQYPGGIPLYGRLDPEQPEANVALFPNVRKQEYLAVVAQVTPEDSALALAMTTPVVAAFRLRQAQEVEKVAMANSEPPPVRIVARMPDPVPPLTFRGLQADPRDGYPSRPVVTAIQGISSPGTAPKETILVAVDRAAPLDPAPPAWALRQGVNMLGPQYQGYNMRYEPDKLDLQAEVGPIAFLGGRTPEAKPVTQPGLYFGLNQRLFGFLLANESAFVAITNQNAPLVNGGSLSAGLDFDLGDYVNLSGMAGLTAIHVLGETVTGPSFAGKVRVPVTDHVSVGLLYRHTGITKFRVPKQSRTGIVNASYVGLGFSFR